MPAMLSPLKVFRALRAFVRVTADPTRLDEVFALADMAEESPDIKRMLVEIRQDPSIGKVLVEKPRLGKVDLGALAKLPEGTLGRAYADFMNARGLRHDDLVLVEGESDLDYLRNHFRETHDLWHVATGFNTDVAGELGVQAVYVAQFRAPLGLTLLAVGMLNTVLKAMDDRDHRMKAIVRGWLIGKQARNMFGYRWGENWSTQLADVRKHFGLDLAAVDRQLPNVEVPSEPMLAQAA
jgi:ubiquinone biosynthesis protein COQ4